MKGSRHRADSRKRKKERERKREREKERKREKPPINSLPHRIHINPNPKERRPHTLLAKTIHRWPHMGSSAEKKDASANSPIAEHLIQ